MASVTSTPNRQSSVLIDSVTHLVPPGHEKPFKQAFYTTAALFFFGLGTVAAVSVYYILEAFIKPLLWAVLCGSFIFPFKYSLTSTLESWLNGQMDSGRPLFAGAIFLPLSLFDSLANKMGELVVENWKMLAALLSIFISLYILYLVQLLHLILVLLEVGVDILIFTWEGISLGLDLCTQYRVVLMTVIIGYFILAIAMPLNNTMRHLALPMWILLLVCIASVAGSLQVPVGVLLLVLITVGALSEAKKRKSAQIAARSLLERTGSLSALLSPTTSRQFKPVDNLSEESLNEDVSDNETNDNESDKNDATRNEDEISPIKPVEALPPKKLSIPSLARPASTGSLRTLKRRHDKKMNKSASTVYFKLLSVAFASVLMFHYVWLVIFIFMPLLYWGIRKLFIHPRMLNIIDRRCHSWLGTDTGTLSIKVSEFIKSRNDVLMPSAIHGMIKLLLKGDKKFHSLILTTLPTVTSILIILVLFIGSVFVTIFLAVKVQQESFVIAQMTSDIINDTVSKHPEYKTWLPDNETMADMMEMLVDNVYVQGRSWISSMVNSSVSDAANVTLVEKQALKVWDRLYTAWFVHKNTNEKPPLLSRQSSSDVLQSDGSTGFVSGLVDLLNMSEVIEIIKENMSALRSVGESLWTVLQSNISLATSLVTTSFTIVMSGSSAIINFIVSIVIFFTALFYLLVSSGNRYKPVEMFGATTIAASIQGAISDVFGASLKMASFYGLYTWLNHTTFGAHLVYIPSVLAALFGVVPIFTTYWACFPSILEVWLLQGSMLRAVLILFFQILPTFMVDVAIYSEISPKGGSHPYITGLAVVGGVYCYGIEGAIIGPIVLCCLLVVVNVFTKVAELPADETPQRQAAIPKPLNLKRVKLGF